MQRQALSPHTKVASSHAALGVPHMTSHGPLVEQRIIDALQLSMPSQRIMQLCSGGHMIEASWHEAVPAQVTTHDLSAGQLIVCVLQASVSKQSM